MILWHSDRSFNPPKLCKTCGEHYVYKQNQCFECFAADESEEADQRREERQIKEKQE